MARNHDRHFSESENLNGPENGASVPEGEERLPAWAQEREDAAKGASPSAGAPQNTETAGRADAFDERDAGADGPEGSQREKADSAWSREAKRVESSQLRRTRHAENDASGKEPHKGKKEKKGKNKKRKKKDMSAQEERRHFIKTMAVVTVCTVVFFALAMMILSNFVSSPLLTLPRKWVTAIVTPVQSVFSSVTDSVANYLRTLKIRGNLEYEYDHLLIRLDDQATDLAILEELRKENETLRDMLFEQSSHTSLNPLGAQVIGKVGNNYFSTLTLNVGTANGVTNYMAVVSGGGLVGVTYDVKEHQCQVRCIIDSDCAVAGLVQSSRDQGTVKGTLGTNGEAMCRMYYLPDNSLPRPGDAVVTSGVGLEFPKGIPIGYIRESTRGMEDNKSYVVLEPKVDFQHLEYVTVYRYRPSYAENAQSRVSASQNIVLEPLTTARPVPGFEMEGVSDFMYVATSTPAPTGTPGPDSPGRTEAPSSNMPVATPKATLNPGSEKGATAQPNLEYVAVVNDGSTPTPTPRPTFTPAPTAVPLPDPGAMTVEDDE